MTNDGSLMSCAKLSYNGSFFGQIECDIAVPEHLKEYFAEMPPIFKNVEITYNDLSPETKAQVQPCLSRKMSLHLTCNI